MLIRKWLPAIIICAIIFALSSLKGELIENSGLGKNPYQINAHFFLYFALGFSLYRATQSVSKSILISFLYSVTDEFHQIFVPGRSWQFFDILVDNAGAGLAIAIIWKYYSHLPKKLKIWLEK